MNVLFALTRNTFREAIRDKILYTIFFFAFLFLLSAPLAGALSAGQGDRIIANFGLAMIHIFGLFLTIFVGSRLIFQEIEKKTIFLLIPKPVPRGTIVLAKFFGLGAVLLLTTGIMSVFFFFLVPFSWQIILCLVLMYFSFLLLLALVLFFAAFMSPLMASIAGILMFVVGNITFSFKLLAQKHGGLFLQTIAEMSYYLFPNFSNLNLKNHVLYTIPYTAIDVVWIVIVTLLFLLLFLFLAMKIFSQKEFR